MIADKKERSVVVSITRPETRTAQRSVQIRFSERRVLLILVDSVLVVASARGIAWIWHETGLTRLQVPVLGNLWLWVLVTLVGWWVLALLNDLYDVPTSSNTPLTTKRLAVVGATAGMLLVMAWLLDLGLPPPVYSLQLLLVTILAVAAWRWLYAVSTYRPPFLHRVLVVGGGSRGRAVIDLLQQGPGAKCSVVGFVDDDAAGRATMAGAAELVGDERDLPQLASELGVHEIVMAKDRNLEPHLFEHLVDCQAQGLRVSWMPDLYGRFYRQTPIEYIDPVWVLQAIQGRPIFSRLQQGSKRLLDLIVVILALPATLLILVPVAIAIRLDSPGPIFYRQTRAGKGNRNFSIFKFRTMVVDAEKDGRAKWAEENDPRITHVGRILRKARLDELPQVLNVLRGEMSLVGPRPERPEFVQELQHAVPFYRTRLMVKPGITGWAQVQYDYGSSTQDAMNKLQYDFYYIQYWSLWMDLYILYRTIWVMVGLKGR
ncbi:MAG TPA: sugar transferase [Candidatus Binatia bacterium]|nr:sugar transferase [Candidatus Binatia bacterium]